VDIEYKIFETLTKGYSEADLTVEHFISTEERDRGGDIMRADGMKINGRISVLFSHGFGPLGQEPIAKALWVKAGEFKGKKGVMAKTQYYPDNIGRRLWEKATQGYMGNWSIGFIPLKWEDIKNGKGFGRDIKEWELLEYSQVGVPMNPGAITPDKQVGNLSFKVMSRMNGDASRDPGNIRLKEFVSDADKYGVGNMTLGEFISDFVRKQLKNQGLIK
jgi:hypothetical protein